MGSRILYLDINSGISGDMFVGAMLQLGVPLKVLKENLEKIGLEDAKIRKRNVNVGHIRGVRFEVIYPNNKEQKPFSYMEVVRMLRRSKLEREIEEKCIGLFEVIARAESQVHKVPLKELHFHQVGAVDSIVDVVCAVICVQYLQVDKIYSSVVKLGEGVWEGHIVPAPATLEILRGVPVRGAGKEGELVTPTGAAILKYFVDQFSPLPEVYIKKVGYGVGSRIYRDGTSILRALIGEMRSKDNIVIVQTNIDDMNPEYFEFLIERLYSEGVLDVFLVPVQGKKNRPAVCINVLVEREKLDKIMETIFLNSTTLGIRYWEVERRILEQEISYVHTPYGRIKVKKGKSKGKICTVSPEYEDCKKIAKEKKVPIKEVYKMVERYILHQ